MSKEENGDRQTRFVWNLFQWNIVTILSLIYLGNRARAVFPPLKPDAWLISTYLIKPAISGLGTILFVVFILTMLIFSLGAGRKYRLFPVDEFSWSHWIPKVAVLLGCILIIEIALRILAVWL